MCRPLKLGYPVVWEEGVTDVVDAIHEFGVITPFFLSLSLYPARMLRF